MTMNELVFDREAMDRICRARKIRRIRLFGSRARGNAKPDSDVDLLVEYDPASGMTMFEFMDLEEEIATLFAGMKVDVVSGFGLSPYFRDSILRTSRVIYEQ